MTTFSPWDLPLLADPEKYSNFHIFLESVTPIVSSKRFSKNISDSLGKDIVECYSFSSLWKFYRERSICGTGVPILLNNGDSVIQFYSPSLSALQIYIQRPTVSPRVEKSCTAIEEKDALSDGSETDEFSISLSNNSSKSSDITSDGSSPKHDASCQISNPFGDLYCQYNETITPYDRIPLIDKIKELAKEYPDLMKLKSIDLSPYSWIAIAWYPIYQIPFTKNVRELSACFLTFHHLSSFKGIILEEENKKFPFINCVEKEHTGGAIRKLKKGKDGDNGSKIAVPPFAVATYKMNGELWMNSATSDQEKMSSYLDAASSWLKLVNFQHNDFNFFMSRRRF